MRKLSKTCCPNFLSLGLLLVLAVFSCVLVCSNGDSPTDSESSLISVIHLTDDSGSNPHTIEELMDPITLPSTEPPIDGTIHLEEILSAIFHSLSMNGMMLSSCIALLVIVFLGWKLSGGLFQ
ncbi:MAG: hypothetical protein RTU30_05810 [Candidatus Thorarchaeota archaeon]